METRYCARAASEGDANWPLWYVADAHKGGLNVTSALVPELEGCMPFVSARVAGEIAKEANATHNEIGEKPMPNEKFEATPTHDLTVDGVRVVMRPRGGTLFEVQTGWTLYGAEDYDAAYARFVSEAQALTLAPLAEMATARFYEELSAIRARLRLLRGLSKDSAGSRALHLLDSADLILGAVDDTLRGRETNETL